jgi:hypothetical protein
MAIVPNKDGNGIKVNGAARLTDVSYEVPTTAGAGAPSGASIFASQLHLNSTTGEVYRALETGTTTWVETNIR